MLFTKLVLQNYGPYTGHQSIDLTPKCPDRPIILIGGMNGSGKTSILDAIQLVLFGKRANCAGRQGLSYGNFLKECSHKGAESTCTSIRLEFERWVSGKKERVRLKREWVSNGSSTKDKVTVVVNNEESSFLSSSWDDVVESYVPLGVSHLFFFNGEKIRELADIEHSASIIRTAIHSLLGADLIDRLIADLHTLERRKLLEVLPSSHREVVDKHRESITQMNERLSAVRSESSTQTSIIKKIQRKLKKVNNRFLREGGELFTQRQDLENHFSLAQRQNSSAQEELRKFATGLSPLFLVRKLLEKTAEKATAEMETKLQRQILSALGKRDATFIDIFKSIPNVSDEDLEIASNYLSEDRQSRCSSAERTTFLDLSSQDANRIQYYVDDGLEDTKLLAGRLLDAQELTEQRVTTIERSLSAVPEAERIAAIIDERDDITQKLNKNALDLENLQQEEEELERKLEEAQLRLSNEIRNLVKYDFDNEDSIRTVRSSESARQILDAFRKTLVKQNLAKIEQLSYESAVELFSKKNLFSSITIDPENYTLSLHDRSKQPVYVAKLSEGERQLLAGSILWGLAKASDYPLPAIIDTPLGRLDSTHRRYLINSYFPNASHQVILLSTDEEITKKNYAKLKSRISHSYHLEHDKSTNQTFVRDGYFPWLIGV